MTLRDAVEEARREGGTVMLAADPRDQRWCAVSVAIDGSIELSVGDPPKGRLGRRPRAQESWLRDHGFARVPDAWVLPVSAGTSADQCAGTLSSALAEAHGVGAEEPLHRVLTQPGAPSVAAALRDLAAAGHGRVDISGGRPSRLWAMVWALDGALRVECELAGREGSRDDVWEEPLSLEGADAATQKLTARMPEADQPVFIAYVERPG